MSTLTVIAKRKDHSAACHCRAKSDSQWGSYDKNSSKAIIDIKSETHSSEVQIYSSASYVQLLDARCKKTDKIIIVA